MNKLTPDQIKFLAGFAVGGLAIIPLLALRVDANVLDSLSRWSASYGGSVQAQDATPIPVPQNTPPVGNTGSQATITPCAAPPPSMASVSNEEMPTSLGKSPASESPKPFVPKDLRAKILLNTRPGNRMRSLIARVGYPNRFDNATSTDFYSTEDGEIAVVSDRGSDTVVSISLLSPTNQ
ncbi:hypothetical protein [Phormidesmis sp. 146-33]